MTAAPRTLLMVFMKPFTMGWRGDTTRTLAIARGLVERGWRVELLAGPLLPEGTGGADVDAAFPGPIHRIDLARQPARTSWPKAIQVLWNRALYLPLHRRWSDIAAAEIGRRRGGAPPPTVVCAYTVHNDLQAVGCALNLAEAYRIPWAWELRDPYPSVSGQGPDRASCAIFRRALAGSGTIITTTEALARQLEATHPELRGRCATVHHCFEGQPAAAVRGAPSAGLELLHAGTLYARRGRSAIPFVRALGLLLDRRPEARDRLRLTLLGPGNGAAEASAAARRLGIADHLRVLPDVPPDQAQRLMAEASVLVLIKHASSAYDMQIPGKLFTYLSMGKPILALAHEGETADIAQRSGLAHLAAPDAPNAILAHLVEYWDHRDDLGALCTPDWTYIRQFSQSAMLDRLESILRP